MEQENTKNNSVVNNTISYTTEVAANSLWNSITDILTEKQIIRIERLHRVDLIHLRILDQ